MRRRLLHAFNLVIAVGLAAAVVITTKPWQIWHFTGWFAVRAGAALLLDGLLVVAWAQRHAVALRGVGHDIEPRRLWSIVTFSNAANNLTPAASGEVARAWFLNRAFGVPVDKAGAAIVFERIYMFGFMASTAILAGFLAVGLAWYWTMLALLVLVLYVTATPAALGPLARRWASREARGGRIRRLIRGIATGGVQLWSKPEVTLKTTLWSVMSFTLLATLFWLAGVESGLALTPAQTWAVAGGSTVVGVLSSLPFGLGAAELSGVGLAHLLGLPVAEVTGAFVMYRLFFTFPMALAGSIAYGHLSTRHRLQVSA